MKKKKLLISSLICANIFLTACSNTNKPVVFPAPSEQSSMTIETISEEQPTEEIVEEESEIIEEEPIIEEPCYLEDYTNDINIVKTDNTVKIYDADNNVIGNFTPEHDYIYLNEDENTYTINYYGNIGYVNKNETYLSMKKVINSEMINKGYVVDNTPIYSDYELYDEFASLNRLEFVEIYKELEDSYLVQTIDYVGFIPKYIVQTLEGNMAVADISNQELRLYEGNTMTESSPVVTGTKDVADRETKLGLFSVYNKGYEYYIVPGSWVKYGLSYDGNRCIHDADKWRSQQQYGGNTYLTNGSHGCINTPCYKVEKFYKVLQIGDKVLVKE